MRIRRATAADAADVVALWTEAYSEDARGGRTDPYEDADFAAAQRLGEVWVVDGEGGSGLAAAAVLYPPGVRAGQYSKEGELEMSRLAVAGSARRRGLARRLVEFCLERASSRGADAVVLWSQPHQAEAHRLYESLGFRRAPEREGENEEGPQLVFLSPICRDPPRPVVLYDGDCGFCKWLLAALLRFDRAGRLRPIPLQDAEANRLLADLDPPERIASWHLVVDGDRLSGGAALPPLLRLLPGGGGPAVALARFPNLTERGYRWVADHRSQLSRLVPPGAKRRADRRVREREADEANRAAAARRARMPS